MSWNFTRILRENEAQRKRKLSSQERIAVIRAMGQMGAAKIGKPDPEKQTFTTGTGPPIGGPEMERAELVAKTARERLGAEVGMEEKRLHQAREQGLAIQDIEGRKLKARERELMLYGTEGIGGGADTGGWDKYDF